MQFVELATVRTNYWNATRSGPDGDFLIDRLGVLLLVVEVFDIEGEHS